MSVRLHIPSKDGASLVGAQALTTMRGSREPLAPIVERLERALVLLAYFIEVDGDVHIPLYEKLEAELAAVRRCEGARARARERLAAYGQLRRTKGDAL